MLRRDDVLWFWALLSGLLAFGVLGIGAMPAGAQTEGVSPARITWQDIQGRRYSLETTQRNRATVFLFLSTQCPIANAYTERIKELARDFTPQGVQFFLVNSNVGDSLETVRRDAAARQFVCPVVKDDGTALADYLQAERTPEAIILDSTGAARYRGRIDDNPDRTKVIYHDVREALKAILAGEPVKRPRALPQGCRIFRETTQVAALDAKTSVTYFRDVAPILNRHCVGCHRAGEAGPFSLTSYSQARIWAAAIKDYTARRLMPPWKPVGEPDLFHDARLLTEAQIAMLARWADEGAPQGRPQEARPAPSAPSSGWRLGTPSKVLQPARAYTLAPEGRDVYRNYVLPFTPSEDLYLKGVEFKPGNRAIVHHIILYFDRSGYSAELERRDTEPGPGYTVPGTGIGVPFRETVWVAGWAPGNTPRFLPPGTAFRLPKGAKLVMQIHYHKTGKIEQDQTQVALWFEPKARVQREMHTGIIAYPYLSIPPGERRHLVRQWRTVRNHIRVWSVLPHMHLLGREIALTATRPDGARLSLIRIADWDFNWQETYRYKTPFALPKGTQLELTAVFDNSEQNPRQPSHPPKRVEWGEQATDEMCIVFFQYTLEGYGKGLEGMEAAALAPPQRVAFAPREWRRAGLAALNAIPLSPRAGRGVGSETALRCRSRGRTRRGAGAGRPV